MLFTSLRWAFQPKLLWGTAGTEAVAPTRQLPRHRQPSARRRSCWTCPGDRTAPPPGSARSPCVGHNRHPVAGQEVQQFHPAGGRHFSPDLHVPPEEGRSSPECRLPRPTRRGKIWSRMQAPARDTVVVVVTSLFSRLVIGLMVMLFGGFSKINQSSLHRDGITPSGGRRFPGFLCLERFGGIPHFQIDSC